MQRIFEHRREYPMKIVRSSMKDQVYTEIKNRILSRQYAPGDPLNIVHLSQELGVSNSPIREALSMLTNEHLVTMNMNSKFTVVALDEDLLQQLNSSIVSLLIGAVRLCLREERMDVLESSMAAAYEEQKAGVGTVDKQKSYWLAVNFDRTIVTATENQMLISIFDNWYNLLYLSTSLMSEGYNNSIEEHAGIIEAIHARDFLAIVEALENHYNKHFIPVNEMEQTK